MEQKTWNARLAWLLDEEGISRSDFAKRVQVSRATVTDWCKGEIKMLTAENADKICRALNINLHWLVSGKLPMRKLPTSGKHEPQLHELDDIFLRLGEEKTEMIMNLARGLDPGKE